MSQSSVEDSIGGLTCLEVREVEGLDEVVVHEIEEPNTSDRRQELKKDRLVAVKVTPANTEIPSHSDKAQEIMNILACDVEISKENGRVLCCRRRRRRRAGWCG